MQVNTEQNSCQVLCPTGGEILTLRQEDIAEELVHGSHVMAFGLDDTRSIYNFKYGTVQNNFGMTYVVSFDFHMVTHEAAIHRENLQVETGLLLLKDKDYVTLQKCTMTGIFSVTLMCSDL